MDKNTLKVFGEVLAAPIHQTFLGDIVPDNAGSSYLSLNRIALIGSSLIGTLFIMLAGIFPYSVMAGLVWASGMVALLMIYRILPLIYKRRRENQKKIEEKIICIILRRANDESSCYK